MAWTGRVSAYLVTKAMAAGSLMVAALLVLLGHAGDQAVVGVLAPVLAGAFTAATGVLLIADLKQPRRFHYILTRPNWGSWLTRGAVILAGLRRGSRRVVRWPGCSTRAALSRCSPSRRLLLGAATAGYTAYLFGQCEGRDLWQTPLLLPILLAQAVTAGAALFLLADVVMDVPSVDALRWTLLGGVGTVAALTFVELSSTGQRARRAGHRGHDPGPLRRRGSGWSACSPASCSPARWPCSCWPAWAPTPRIGTLAAVAALAGLAGYEDAFVRAGQSVPLS